jgi:hypothetical protein
MLQMTHSQKSKQPVEKTENGAPTSFLVLQLVGKLCGCLMGERPKHRHSEHVWLGKVATRNVVGS